MTAPTPAVPTFTDGEILSQTKLNALGSNLTNLYSYDQGGFRTRRPMVAVRVTSGTVASGGNVTCVFGAEDIDTDNMWTGSASGQISINTAGIYLIYFGWGHTGAYSQSSARILVNGTSDVNDSVAVMSANCNQPNCTAVVPLNAGSVCYFFMVQNTGTTQTLTTQFGGCRAFAVWLAPLGNS